MALDAICIKAMAHLPEHRYANALDLAADLDHWLADERVSAYHEPLRMRLSRWIKRHRALVSTAAALFGTVVLGLGVEGAGDLLGPQKRPAAPGLKIQKRTPIISNPRIRGTRTEPLKSGG